MKKKMTDEERKKIKQLADKRYREKNREIILAKQKEYYLNNLDKRKESAREYAKNNSDKRKEYAKEYAKNNSDKRKEYVKEYREKNKEILLTKTKEQGKIYREKNREIILAKKKEYYNINKDKAKAYRNANKEVINAKARLRLKNPLAKLKHSCRTMLNKALKRNGYMKQSKTEQILCCSFEEFKLYLESKFEPWMSWDNYGLYNGTANYGWDIDHIIPQSRGKVEADIITLNHYTNLQPLCSYYNRDFKKDN